METDLHATEIKGEKHRKAFSACQWMEQQQDSILDDP